MRNPKGLTGGSDQKVPRGSTCTQSGLECLRSVTYMLEVGPVHPALLRLGLAAEGSRTICFLRGTQAAGVRQAESRQQQDEGIAWLCLQRLQHMSERASATAAGAISVRSRGQRFGFVLGHQAGFGKVTVPCFRGNGSRGSLRNLNGSQFLRLSEGRRWQWISSCQSCAVWEVT